MTAPAALAGVRVLDFTRVLAGPFATMMLADLGADVIKVESPAGDDTRQWGPPWFDGAHGEREAAYYLSVNRNKRSLVLNLRHAEAQRIARELAADSHILVENLRPGGMAAFGLDYDSLAPLAPALVYGSITGYGQSGPYRDRPGYDFVVQAQSGLMSITGPEDGAPYKLGVAISDVIAGLYAAASLMAALRHAESSGRGQHVDIALLDTSIAALVNIASAALVTGDPPRRYGNAHASIVPYQLFEAADRPFAVAVGNDRQFSALCAVIGQPALATDPRFASNPQRVTHREALLQALEPIFRTRLADAWVEALLAAGVPAGPVNDVQAALTDPQVQARGLIHELPLWERALRLVGPPIGFSETPAQVRMPPPAIGQHSDEVLHERLGLGTQEIARLREIGALG